MVVLYDMRRVGIGFDGFKCMEEMVHAEWSMAVLAQEITQGQGVDLTSHEQVYQFLVDRGVPPELESRVCATQRDTEAFGGRSPTPTLSRAGYSNGGIWALNWDSYENGPDTLASIPCGDRLAQQLPEYMPGLPQYRTSVGSYRHLFVPRQGHVLIKADYSQAQMRILAHLSGDPRTHTRIQRSRR